MSHCSVTWVGAESGGNMKVDLLLPADKFWMWLLFPATSERDYIGGHVTGIPLCRDGARINQPQFVDLELNAGPLEQRE